MSATSWDRSDRRLVLLALMTLAAAAVYIRWNYEAAFPSAAIDLRYSKSEITARATAFLHSQGYRTEGFRELTLFEQDSDAQVYLERELGLAEANRLAGGPVAVWNWRARWFQPPRKEEFRVLLSPAGRLTGFASVVPEGAPGERLSIDDARSRALAFLASQSQLAHRLVEEQREDRPQRTDYTFTWEQEGFRAKDATYRRSIVVQGGRIGEYREFLHVPEAWKREYARLRSANELYQQVANAGFVILVVSGVGWFVQWLRSRRVAWGPLLWISGIVAVANVCNDWNLIPFAIDNMDTAASYGTSLTLAILDGLGAGTFVFLEVVLGAAAGAPLYTAAFPGLLSLDRAFTRAGLATRSFFRATVAGYGFAAAHLCFVVAFYLYGRKVGIWTPQDVRYSDLLSTFFPFLYPIAISLMAAAGEEFWFRLLGVPLFTRWLRSRWLGIVVPAFLWGFLHSNYPQQPGWVRGVEVGLIGVAAGVLMVRFGIVATLVWHFTVDAVLIGIFLFQASEATYRWSAAAVCLAILAPLLASLWLYRRNGGFVAPEEPAAAAPEPVAAPAPAPEEVWRDLAPPLRLRWLGVGALAAVAAALLLHFARPGEGPMVDLSRAEAAAAAGKALRESGEDPTRWTSVSSFASNFPSTTFEYLRQQSGAATAQSLLAGSTNGPVWITRFFRPLEKNEWRIAVNQQGRVVSIEQVLAENAPGASLDAATARATAEALLAAQGWKLDGWSLVDAQQERRPSRTDHFLTWERTAPLAGEAKARLSVEVLGDRPSALRRFIKIPEAWQRDYERPRLSSFLFPGSLAVIAVFLLVAFIRRLGGHPHGFGWRHAQWATCLTLGLALLDQLNEMPLWFTGYRTTVPLTGFLTQRVISAGLSILFAGGMVGTLWVVAAVFRQWALPHVRMARAGVWPAVGAAALIAAARVMTAKLAHSIPGPHPEVEAALPGGVDTALPFLSGLVDAWLGAALLTLLGYILAFSALRFFSPRASAVLAAVLVLAYAASNSFSLVQFPFYCLIALLWLGAAALLMGTLALDAAAAGAGVLWAAALLRVFRLAAQPEPGLRLQALLLAVAAFALGLAILRAARRQSPGPALTGFH